MVKHNALWTSPEPLWGRFSSEPGSATSFLAGDQAAPAILRFSNDEFMDQLFGMLAADPRQIGDLIARPETWRSPSNEAQDLVERIPMPRLARSLTRLRTAKAKSTEIKPTTREISKEENGVPRTMPLKLYHPAHQRHYLVAANLVCGRLGFPDRDVESSCEQVKFVLRRLIPKDDTVGSPLEEYGFVKDATETRWQRVETGTVVGDSAATLIDGEEMLPLFPLNFQDDNGHPRRLLAGNVPVGRREEYMSTRKQSQTLAAGRSEGGVAANPSVVAERKEQFKMEVTEPWKNLIRSSIYAANRIMEVDVVTGNSMLVNAKEAAARNANNHAQGQSWLILLDFADYLKLHVKPVWDCMNGSSNFNALSPAQQDLVNWLNNTDTNRGLDTVWNIERDSRLSATSLSAALLKIGSARANLEKATRSFPDKLDDHLTWPDFIYLLAGVRGSAGAYEAWGIHKTFESLTVDDAAGIGDKVAPAPYPKPVAPQLLSVQQEAENQTLLLDKLVQLVINAIDLKIPAMPAPPLPFAVRLRDALTTTSGDPGWFTMRCVYVRCDCGTQKKAVLSAPTQKFQLANFFDSDAPARPIRISLPLDTTPAGMRKHSKNTAFVISDVLCGQIQRAKGLGLGDLVRSVLPWPFHKDLDVGGVGPCKNSVEANIGMICSLSIPIVTICALILLMIIVSLLDFIFRWMPWFIVCFPIPGLKAKKDS